MLPRVEYEGASASSKCQMIAFSSLLREEDLRKN